MLLGGVCTCRIYAVTCSTRVTLAAEKGSATVRESALASSVAAVTDAVGICTCTSVRFAGRENALRSTSSVHGFLCEQDESISWRSLLYRHIMAGWEVHQPAVALACSTLQHQA